LGSELGSEVGPEASLEVPLEASLEVPLEGDVNVETAPEGFSVLLPGPFLGVGDPNFEEGSEPIPLIGVCGRELNFCNEANTPFGKGGGLPIGAAATGTTGTTGTTVVRAALANFLVLFA
jgi:hypothetical protein